MYLTKKKVKKGGGELSRWKDSRAETWRGRVEDRDKESYVLKNSFGEKEKNNFGHLLQYWGQIVSGVRKGEKNTLHIGRERNFPLLKRRREKFPLQPKEYQPINKKKNQQTKKIKVFVKQKGMQPGSQPGQHQEGTGRIFRTIGKQQIQPLSPEGE